MYPDIKFPEFNDNFELSNLNKYVSELVKVVKDVEDVTRLLWKEVTLRPTRFETMGHMLTRYLMRNQP